MTETALSAPLSAAAAPPSRAAASRPGGAIADVLWRAELAGLRLAMQVRLVAIVAISLVLFLVQPPGPAIGGGAALLTFAGSAWLHYRLARRRPRRWLGLGFYGLDLVLLLAIIFVVDPLLLGILPHVQFRFAVSVFLFLLVGLTAIGYSPRLTFWSGVMAAFAWSAVAAFLVLAPRSLWGPQPLLDEAVRDPFFVGTTARAFEAVALVLVGGTMALVVARSRRLLGRQIEAARERANLARYFSPKIVDRLAQAEASLRTPRQAEAAVLFADVVGFTARAEALTPERQIGLLRRLHAGLSAAVFAHDGTLDKYLGDGVMATFGAPEPGPRDAANALAAARAMREVAADLSAELEAAGEQPLRLSVGLDFGTVVMGDIGTDERLEYAVLGDTVNRASRLEAMTRTLGCAIVVSQAVVDRARAEVGEPAARALLDGFASHPGQPVRGFTQPVDLWLAAAAG